MKSLVSLCILILCTACMPQDLPAIEPSPTFLATDQPTFTSFSASTTTPTPVWFPPTPLPIFSRGIGKVVTNQQGQLYAAGHGDAYVETRHFAHWDGAKWIMLGDGLPAGSNALAVDSAGHLYTETIISDGIEGDTNIMRWDGVKWGDIASNFSTVVDTLKVERLSGNVPVRTLAVDGEDNLYAAGSYAYQSADAPYERSMGYVAKWNKETWVVLGQGLDRVNILDMAVSATGRVYVSGENQSPDGETCYLAQWDGKTWTRIDMSKLGSKLDSTECRVAVDKSERLYVSGRFQDHAVGFIARWDGEDWVILAEQVDGFVSDITADTNGGLYIGGYFGSVDGIHAQHIAYWDGSVWRALAEGVNGVVNALAFDPSGELYTSGEFTRAGGVPVISIANWDGEAWHALGP